MAELDMDKIVKDAIYSLVIDGKTLPEWIELLKDYKRREWISVEGRLPTESDGTVLVCFPDVQPYNLPEHYINAKHDQRVRMGKYSQFSKRWYIGDMSAVGEVSPTHWMPLPEPPKEETP